MLRQMIGTAAILYSVAAHSFDIQPYIVNGSNANISKFPSFASLFYRSNTLYSTNSFCGATMINSEYVLTAAHCIYGQDQTMLHTVVAPQLEDENQFLSSMQGRVSEFYYPDTYSDSSATLWRDDIAILKLESPLSTGDYQYLLNNRYNNSFPNTDDFKAVGHGYIEGNVPGGTQLLETDLEYISLSACQAEFGGQLTSKQLCFGGAEQGGYQNSTCSGDSGGPVYFYDGVEYIQVGITSFGPSVCGDVRYSVTSVFTDIYDYQAWINQVLNGEVEPKAYVVEEEGRRVLVNNDHGSSQAEIVVESNESNRAGSFSLYLMITLLLLGLVRAISHRITIKYKYKAPFLQMRIYPYLFEK
ncbi:S1 family peptidase [Vibrio atypicus]|uniref:S1 family peptidase n=1 Tax=Vibrio atypicus TaxID=558271 RepID=UPI0013598250|nr:trypsin-like serine protease [Vibrio atypicus]